VGWVPSQPLHYNHTLIVSASCSFQSPSRQVLSGKVQSYQAGSHASHLISWNAYPGDKILLQLRPHSHMGYVRQFLFHCGIFYRMNKKSLCICKKCSEPVPVLCWKWKVNEEVPHIHLRWCIWLMLWRAPTPHHHLQLVMLYTVSCNRFTGTFHSSCTNGVVSYPQFEGVSL
jgi:hypothetical protein